MISELGSSHRESDRDNVAGADVCRNPLQLPSLERSVKNPCDNGIVGRCNHKVRKIRGSERIKRVQGLPKEHDEEGLRANAPDKRLVIKQARQANGSHQKTANQDEPGFSHVQRCASLTRANDARMKPGRNPVQCMPLLSDLFMFGIAHRCL